LTRLAVIVFFVLAAAVAVWSLRMRQGTIRALNLGFFSVHLVAFVLLVYWFRDAGRP
jgi:hypothetical protein